MPLPFRRRIQPEFVTPPAEDRRVVKDAAEIYKRLDAYRQIPRSRRTHAAQMLRDDLLDDLSALRNQSRTDASIENYQENPW